MLERNILRPVLPEIDAGRLDELQALIAAERKAEIAPDPLRRLVALLPREPLVAEAIAVRLKLSNKARKRTACAASSECFATPMTLAYRAGTECAVDRLLLAGKATDAAAITDWKPPRLPIGGGALIARGLIQGPLVARTLREIENSWVESGFPKGPEFDRIVADALEQARAGNGNPR